MLYNLRDAVPDGDYVVPIGIAEIKRTGRDVTIIATGRMVHVALAAAESLAKEDISAEVIDPRSLVPLDVDTLVTSVKKTSRAVVVDGGYQQNGVSGEIAASVAEHAFDWLDAPVIRIGGAVLQHDAKSLRAPIMRVARPNIPTPSANPSNRPSRPAPTRSATRCAKS